MEITEIGAGSPKICVVGCLHGNERIGKEMIDRINDNYYPTLGSIRLIVANTRALEENRRFIESDLNRSFPGDSNGTYEERLACDIMKRLADCDYVVDIHSTTAETDPFIIITRHKCLNLARYFPIEKVVIMSNIVANGKSLIDHVACGISIEFPENYPREHAYNIIKSGLENIVSGNEAEITKEIFEVYGIVKGIKNAKTNIKNFSLVKKGEVFAELDGNIYVAEEDFYPVLYGEKEYKDIFCLKARKLMAGD